MGQFLFVVPPLAGHINPTISVARALREHGHDVAWAGNQRLLDLLVPTGSEVLGLSDSIDEQRYQYLVEHSLNVRGISALKALWEDLFVPLCRAMTPSLEEAVDKRRPDVLVVDQQAFAGTLVARRRGIPWATFATTSASVADAFGPFTSVRVWVDTLLDSLQREAGLEHRNAPQMSEDLVVVFSTQALLGPSLTFPAHYHFVGPSVSSRPEITPFPWEKLASVPRVLCSLGTINPTLGERFYRQVVLGLGDAPYQVILVAPDEFVQDTPKNFLRQSYVPQLALLPHLHAVICHGGHNTVAEALYHGIPLVVAPIKDDQPTVANQVVAAGAGIRVKFGRVRAQDLRYCVDRVLGEPSFSAAAAAIRDSFRQAGGAAKAANLLEGLLNRGVACP